MLDELPGGTGQLVHAPDAGQVFAVNALGGGDGAVLAHKDGGHLDPLAAEITYLGGGIVHAVGPAVIPAQRVFRAGRDAAAVIGGGIRQQDEQVAGSRAGVKIQQVACRPQGQAVPVPARGEILVDTLPLFVFEMLEHPEHGVAPQAAKAAYPHRNVAAGKALGQDGTLCRNDFLAVEPGGRGIQQQVYGERGLVLLLGTAEDPAVVQQRSPPDPLRVQIAAAGDPGVGLLVDEDAVLDLLGQPEHHAAVELPVFGIVSPVAVGLQFGLLGQMFRFGGGGLLRAGHAGGKPQMAPQMVPGAELLLGLAQPFRRVERAAKAALDVGPVLGGGVVECNKGQPRVGPRPPPARGSVLLLSEERGQLAVGFVHDLLHSSAVQLGQHHGIDVQPLVEALSGVHRILTGH